jgi:colanic acid/amylovoran biosynthesis glycosyltransferase
VDHHAASVLIYTEPLLAPSMTFVRSQGEALRSFVPYYVSPSCLSQGLSLPADRVVVMHGKPGAIAKIAATPFKLFGYAPRFVRRLRQLNPALLHAHFGPMGVRALPLANALKIPLIVTFHGYDATIPDHLARKSRHYSHRVYIKRREILKTKAALFIAVSEFVRGQLLRQGLPPEKIVVHYIGIDVDVFCPDPLVSRERVVLFAGRLDRVKGCDYLIRAMARLQAESPDLKLMVIGDGPMRRELEHCAKASLRRFQFAGFQPAEVVREWMNRAWVFAAPGVRTHSGSEEGLGLALLEAQAMGLPVVGFSSGGISEAVVNGETGLLAAVGDVDGLTRSLRTLIDNPSLRSKMATAARTHVCRKFNLQTQTARLEDIYSRISRGLPHS